MSQLIQALSPSQEHFLKKYLLKNRLAHELSLLADDDFCQKFGDPFVSTKALPEEFPLLRFFFDNFISTFPFIATHSDEERRSIWQDTVQPFLENLNSKGISNSNERKEQITKRRQINTKVLSGLLLFFNSMIISKQELVYLKENKLKPSATGKLEKLAPTQIEQTTTSSTAMHLSSEKNSSSNVFSEKESILDGESDSECDYSKLNFVNNLALNIVAVRKIQPTSDDEVNVGSASPPSAFYWKPIRYFTDPAKPKGTHHFEFIIEVIKRKKVKATENGNGLGPRTKSYTYSRHFINRPYHEFKDLQNALKKIYPGLMSTEVSKLPKKLKHDSGIKLSDKEGSRSSSDSEKAVPLAETKSSDSANSASSSANFETTLHREKLRLALRGYLISLLKFPEISLSATFKTFIDDESKTYKQLSPEDELDRQQRIENDQRVLNTQYEFHQQTSKLIIGLAKDFDDFKKKLVMNPNTVTDIFMEIGTSQSVEELSPLLRTFFEWSKLEIAATLYQVFLSQDNSGEWLSKCKKFHRLFPYGMVYGILRFTNPMNIVSKVVDVLLVNIPSISFWKSSDAPPQARNLLSMMFVMLLDEDLNDFEKELKILREEKLGSTRYDVFLERLTAYVNVDQYVSDDIRKESLGNDLVMTILETDLIEPKLESQEDLATLAKIKESYIEYDNIFKKKNKDLHHESNGGSHDKTKHSPDSSVYLNLKQYWQIQIRKRDKDLMKQLWQEPELTMLIKKFLTIFYQPLMKVFGRSDIHLVFKDFQKFMDDLMVTLSKLSDGEVFVKSSFEIFEILKSLLDRHEIVFWRFLHNLYRKDDDKLFIGLIKWVERFLIILRLKFTDPEKVSIDLERLTLFIDDKIDHELFTKQLNALTNQTLEKRKLFKEFLEQKARKNENNVIPGTQDDIDRKWEKVNNDIFGQEQSEFGLNNEDLEDFNLEEIALADSTSSVNNFDNTSETYSVDSENENESGHKNLDRELQLKLKELEEEQQKYGTSELDKFDDILKKDLVSLLKDFKD